MVNEVKATGHPDYGNKDVCWEYFINKVPSPPLIPAPSPNMGRPPPPRPTTGSPPHLTPNLDPRLPPPCPGVSVMLLCARC